MSKYNDNTIIQFGIHKGKALKDSYLLWLYENNKCNSYLKEYIEENLDSIKKNIKK